VPKEDVRANYSVFWTVDDKECYVFNIVSGNHLPWHAVRSRINDCIVIGWPRNNDWSVVEALKDINSLWPRWKKKTEYPFGHIHLCRT
jgi:hypothetical protein